MTAEANTESTFESREGFDVFVVVDSGSTGIVTPGGRPSPNSTIPAQFAPTVPLNSNGRSGVVEGITATLMLTSSETLSEDVTINLLRSADAT